MPGSTRIGFEARRRGGRSPCSRGSSTAGGFRRKTSGRRRTWRLSAGIPRWSEGARSCCRAGWRCVIRRACRFRMIYGGGWRVWLAAHGDPGEAIAVSAIVHDEHGLEDEVCRKLLAMTRCAALIDLWDINAQPDLLRAAKRAFAVAWAIGPRDEEVQDLRWRLRHSTDRAEDLAPVPAAGACHPEFRSASTPLLVRATAWLPVGIPGRARRIRPGPPGRSRNGPRL